MLYYEDIELDAPRRSADYVVDKDALIAFARQWDPQPYHTDEDAAKHYPMGLIGSSVQSYAILTKLQTEMPGDKPAVISGLGIDEWRTPNPLKPGDTVHAVCYVEAKRESASRPRLGILTSVSTLMNQRGDVILTYKSTGLVMKRPSG